MYLYPTSWGKYFSSYLTFQQFYFKKPVIGPEFTENHHFLLIIPPANFVCRGYTVFTLSVRPCVRPSVTLCFLNNSKSHCWIFIKPCKHVHICKTNTLDKKVRARGQIY